MKLHLDEDISDKVAKALRDRGVDATSTHEVGMRGASDAEQLTYAASQGRCMVTRNVSDFCRLTSLFLTEGRPHAGLIVVPSFMGDIGPMVKALEESAKQHPEDRLEAYACIFLKTGDSFFRQRQEISDQSR